MKQCQACKHITKKPTDVDFKPYCKNCFNDNKLIKI